jgi:hypothetical protein
MKALFEKKLKIPTWALTPLLYADEEGLTEDEQSALNNWCNSMHSRFPGCYMVISPLDTGAYFAYYPEFGKGADVLDCDVTMTKHEMVIREIYGNP